jgi:hypothetical protein
MKSKQQKKVSLNDTKRALHKVMQQDGLIFPETPEDIGRMEAAIDDSHVPTPDVNAFLKFLRGEATSLNVHTSKMLPFEGDVHVEALAMAARNGGIIDPTIRQRMNEHRSAAEKNKPKA